MRIIPKKPIQTVRETIEKHEGIELTDSIPFSAIRIIDSRYDSTMIGFYWNSYLTLQDSSSQPVALQHVIDKYYHSLYTPGKDTLIIQLEKLSIQEEVIRDTNFILTAGYISCKKYFGTDKGYIYMGSADTMMYDKFSYATVFKLHKNGRHTNYELWDYYLLRLCEAMIKGPAVTGASVNDTTRYFTAEEIKQTGLQKRIKPILTTDSLQPGFYNNFPEFINNKPGFTYDSSNALPKLLTIMHYRVGKNISNEAPDTSYWGYCDGKNLYVRYKYNFYQLERRDGGFYIAPTLDGRRRYINAAGWDLLTGIAALSAGIVAKQGVTFSGFDAVSAPEIPLVILPLGGTYILGLQLDWDTGKITY
jgi:hypothetical protein